MKQTVILIILLTIIAVQGYAQADVPQKLVPLKQFKNKEAFILANFTFQNEQYNMKKVSFFTDEVSEELSFYFYIMEYKNTLVPRVLVYFYTLQELKEVVKKEKKALGVTVEIDNNINTSVNIDLYNELKKIGTNVLLKWDAKKYRDVFDKITVQNISTDYLFYEIKWALENPGIPYKPPYF